MPIDATGIPNPIAAMTATRAALMDRRAAIKREYDGKLAAVDAEIKGVDDAIRIARDSVAPYLCTECGGSGNRRVPDAAGQMEDRPCKACKGTGYKPVPAEG